MSALPRSADEEGLIFKTADPILASDQTLRIVLWNKGAEALLGFRASEVLGTPCYVIFGCRDQAGRLLCRCNCTDQLRGCQQEPAPTFDHELSKKDGERVWVNVTTIVAASQGGPSVLVHLLRDLTRQKEIEALLRQLASGAAKLSAHPGGKPETSEPPAETQPTGPSSSLVTVREREVILLLAHGASTDAIAAQLSITHRTARNHIQNILSKLRVHSRLQAVAYASTRGLL